MSAGADSLDLARGIEFIASWWQTVPGLVVSGGGSPALAEVAGRVASRIGGSHCVLEGAGHASQRSSERFNPLLEEHLDAAA